MSRLSTFLLDVLAVQMNADIQAAVSQIPGVNYVDVSSAFEGHEVCSSSPNVVPPATTLATSGWFHPNVAGQQKLATLVAAAMAGQRNVP